MHTKDKGNQGEDIAAGYLRRKNYKIIERNYYSRWGEIDIVAFDEDKGELVFVEVKARTNNRFGYPEEAVDERKIEKIEMTINKFLRDYGFEGTRRIDCIAVEMDYSIRKAKIFHYENIGW